MFCINLLGNTSSRISWLFVFFLLAAPFLGDAIGAVEELEPIVKGIEFRESFLKNGRIQLSSVLEIIDSYDDKSGAVTQSYLMNQHFIWIFKDKRWRIEQKMEDSNGEYYNIQIFDGEKKIDLFIGGGVKVATISNDTRYINPTYIRAYGSPRHYMLELLEGRTVSEALKDCQKTELIGMREIDGLDCGVIKFIYESIHGDKYSGLVWVAPSKGYATVKSEVNLGSTFLRVRLAKDLREWSEGIWLPTRGSFTRNLVKNGKVIPQLKADFAINSVELKKEISEDSFELKFPPGTLVYDKTANTSYRIPEEIPSEEELFESARKAKEGKYRKVKRKPDPAP